MFLSLTLVILSSASSPQLVHSTTTVEIGVIAPNGVNEYAAIISIANDDINDYMRSKGLDYSFTYIIEDAEGQASIHLEHVQKFRSRGISLLIGGGWSGHAQTSLSYINDNDMLLFSPSSTLLDLSIPDDNLFRLTPSDRWYTLAKADVVWSWGIDAAIVIFRGDEWSPGIYEQLVSDFMARGGKTIEGYGYEPSTSDFHDIVSAAEAKAIELAEDGRENVGLLLISTAQESENIILEAKNFPTIYNLKWFSVGALTRPQYFIGTMPTEAEHLKLFSVEQDIQEARDVEDRFVSLIGMPFTANTANLYDICWIYALSVFSTNSVDAETIKKVLPDIAAGYNGITGNCELDSNGDRAPYKFNVWGVGEIAGNIQLVKYAYYDFSIKDTVWDTDLITPIRDGEVTPVNMLPVAVINGPYSGEEDSSISFSSAGSRDTDGNIVEYRWDFGDGQTSTSANPSHTYEEAGTYTVTLRVTDNQGATNIATTSCTIEAAPPPEEEKGGFPWLPIVLALGAVAAAAAYLYLQKMKPRVKVRKPADFDIGIEPEEIPADGKSTSIIKIGLLDDAGKPFEATKDMAVTISASGGVVVSSSEVKRDEVTGATTITDSVKQAIEGLLSRREEAGMRISIKQGETSVEAAIVSSLEVGDVTLSVSAPGIRRRTMRMRFTEKRRYCMHCGASMSILDRACPKCGLMPPSGIDVKSCPNCGEVIPSVAKFCSECGAGQPTQQ
jgi:branched-chain amino acid transport system substrate-binding protein